MKNMQNKQQSDQNLPKCEDVIKNIQFFTRLVLSTLILMCLFDITYPNISSFMLNDPQMLFPPNYQFWRLVTPLFFEKSLFLSLVIVFNYYAFLSKLQRRTSTIWLIFSYFFIGMLIQIIFAGVWWLINGGQHTNWFAYGGATSIWCNLLMKYCYFNRNLKIKLCCFPYNINKVFYPFIMVGILTVLSFKINLGQIIGLLLALIQCKLCGGFFISNQSGFIKRIDQCCALIKIGNLSSWVRCKTEKQLSPYSGIQYEQDQIPSTSPSSTMNSDTFQNQKGYSLNDD